VAWEPVNKVFIQLLDCRNTVPELVKFLEDGLDQMDPEQEVEEQYKLVNEERYQWMASRFLLMGTDQYMVCYSHDVLCYAIISVLSRIVWSRTSKLHA